MSNGVVMLMIWPDGKVLSAVADFDDGGADAQETRARDRMYRLVATKLCNPAFAECLSRYELQAVIRSMTDNKGFKIERVLIGHEATQ